MTDRERRADARRRQWTSEVVVVGDPKDSPTEGLTAEDRLRALAALNVRAWTASGRPWPEPVPRDQWPGEIYELP